MSDSLPSASPRAWYTGGAQRKKGLGLSECQASLLGGLASITLGMPALFFWDQELAQPPRYILHVSECECESVCVCVRAHPSTCAAASPRAQGSSLPSDWGLPIP